MGSLPRRVFAIAPSSDRIFVRTSFAVVSIASFRLAACSAVANPLKPIEDSDGERLRVCQLYRDASVAKGNVGGIPGLMKLAFRVCVGGVSVLKLNGVGGVEVPWLQTVRLQPDIPDARHFS